MCKKEQTAPKVSLWNLFLTFFKIGAFTFGGGYAMVSLMEEELADKKKWITSQDMLDMLVLAESTPGAIAVNTATSVGYKLRGAIGGIVATLGVVLPSFVIISALFFVINIVADNVWYKAAFKGVNACVTVLVINAFVKMGKQLPHDMYNYVTAVVAFFAATFLPEWFSWFDVIYLIILGGVVGVVMFAILRKQGKPLPLESFAEDELPDAQKISTLPADILVEDNSTSSDDCADSAKEDK